MPLTVLPTHHQPSPDDLRRLFHQATARWVEHLAQPQLLTCAQAYVNASLAGVADANHVRDVALPPSTSASAAFDEVTGHFAAAQTRCAYWVMNPSAPSGQTQPMIDHLLGCGYRPRTGQIFLASQSPAAALPAWPGLTIIPTRASFRHAQQLFEQWGQEADQPQLADAAMLHLDDPHWDSLLALQNGRPLAHAGVLTVGPVGRIDQLYVIPAVRRQGIGQLMLSRVLEICARACLDHVMLAVAADDQPAKNLCRKLGLNPIGATVEYVEI